MGLQKRGFVLYFDACRSVNSLDAAQRGLLLTALFDYAETVTEVDVSPEVMVERHPELQPATQMAFRFMADAIARDTEKWRRQQANRRAAAVEHNRKLGVLTKMP